MRITVVLLTAALTAGLTSPALAGYKPNVKFCGHRGSATIASGKNPPQYPRTSCRFARKTVRLMTKQWRENDSLPIVFKLKVNRQRLNGSALILSSVLLIRMKNRRRFVQLTAPY